MSIADSRSFAADFLGQMNGANGMSVAAALSEFVDNARDANSSEFCLAITPVDVATRSWLMIFCDQGHGIKDLPIVFGLGQNTHKKSEGKTGLKNTGHLAAVSTFRPDSLTYYSRNDGLEAPNCSLSFDIRSMIAARDAVMGSEGSRDWKDPRLHIGHFMQSHPRSRTEEEIELLDQAIRLVKSDLIRQRLTEIRYKTGGSHFLAIYTFSNTDGPALDQEILKALNFYRLSYCSPLRSGFKIHYESLQPVSPTNPAVLRTLDESSALDPLGPSQRSSEGTPSCQRHEGPPDLVRTYLDATVYKAANDSVYLECILRRDSPGDTKTFWASGLGIIQGRPTALAGATPQGDLKITLTTIPKAMEDAQAKEMDFPVEDLRGVYPEFNHRILGLPFYDGKAYGARRNAGGVRILVSYTSHTIAENYMAIQSHKHKTDLGNAHPTIKKFLKDLIKIIISKYSGYAVSPRRSLSTSPIDTVYRELLGLPLTRPAAPPRVPTPAPSVEDSSSESEEDEESGEESEGEVDEDPEVRPPAPVVRPPPFTVTRSGEQIRLAIGALRYSFPHRDLFDAHRQILLAEVARRRLLEGGPDGVRRFLEAYVALHA